VTNSSGLLESRSGVRNALIVGGGMGGLSAAIAMAQRKIEVTVVERAHEWTGAAIHFHYGPVYALDELGILDQILERAHFIPADAPSSMFGIFTAQGDRLPLGEPELGEDWSVPPTIAIYRPILGEIMMQAARQHGVELLVGHTYTSMKPSADAVDVELTTGDRRSFDLVVGADGINSGLREQFFGEVDGPTYIGSMAFRMMFKDAPDSWRSGLHVAQGTTISANLLPGNHFYLAVPHKMERRQIEQDEAREIVLSELDKYRPSEMFDAIAERLTDDIDIIVGAYEWIFVPPPWHRGRIVLVGDAIHATAPTIGSAGGMAIEDGVVLAQELAATEDVDRALTAYAERRADRAKLVVVASETLMRTHQERRSPEEESVIRLAAYEKLVQPY
jgi:2-polyprenyl-6-methoxyphenol hydroxylase-like FAD-dependent oxidoreductase